MTEKLNILSLHRMGNPKHYREAVRELEYMFRTYAQDHNCVVHDADLPVPEMIKTCEFDAIILGPTFLCSRYERPRYQQTLIDYDFVRASTAVKIALPQDDYDCSGVLDRWVSAWAVDRVYTVCPEHWDVLYPSYSASGDIRLGFTGYLSDNWIDNWAHPRPHASRTVDVSYRASKLPANFGSVGDLKSSIAHRFLDAVSRHGLVCDISTRPQDMIPGKAWHDFVESSRACLVTPSGSSLLDPEGEYRLRVRAYMQEHPNADFHEVADACFPGEDLKYRFTAISPRNIEAGLAGTVQIGTPGAYSGLLTPGEDYILLAEDCSNADDVAATLKSPAELERIGRNAKEKILSEPRLRFENHVQELVDFIRKRSAEKNVRRTPDARMQSLLSRYRLHQQFWKAVHWDGPNLLRSARDAVRRRVR